MIKSVLHVCFFLLQVFLWTRSAGVVPIKWSSAGMQCEKGVVVLEHAYYGTPRPGVCDAHCRTGPEAKGNNCYFINNTHCAQEVTQAEVNVIYGTCSPLSAPSSCDIARSGLGASLSVGYTCLPGSTFFDPYNLVTAWKSNDVTFILGYNSSVTADATTQCRVKSLSSQPNSTVKVITLKSPLASSDMNNSSRDLILDDVIFRLHDDTWRVEESIYPRWRSVFAKEFVLVFDVRAASDRSRPFWVSLHNTDATIEVKCEPVLKMPTTTVIMDTTEEVTSSSVTPFTEVTSEVPTTQTPGTSFTLAAMLIAGIVPTVGVLCIGAVVCCVQQSRRATRTRRPTVEYYNRGEDSFVVTSLGSRTDERDLIPTPHRCYENQERQRCGPCPLPPGSHVSNGTYGLYVDMNGRKAGMKGSDARTAGMKGSQATTTAIKGSQATVAAMKGREARTDATNPLEHVGSVHHTAGYIHTGVKGSETRTTVTKGSEAWTAATKGSESCDVVMDNDYLSPAAVRKPTAMQSDYLTPAAVRKPTAAQEYTSLNAPSSVEVTRASDIIHPSEFPDEKTAVHVGTVGCTQDEEENVYMEIVETDAHN